jgi:hypothetical protein
MFFARCFSRKASTSVLLTGRYPPVLASSHGRPKTCAQFKPGAPRSKDRHRLPLGARTERPRYGCATEKRDELAPIEWFKCTGARRMDRSIWAFPGVFWWRSSRTTHRGVSCSKSPGRGDTQTEALPIRPRMSSCEAVQVKQGSPLRGPREAWYRDKLPKRRNPPSRAHCSMITAVTSAW